MGYEILIGLRYTLAGRGDRFVTFVSVASMLGIMLGVATLIVVLAVMTGFQRELRERILAVASHLEVVALDDAAFVDWRRPAEQYLEHPQVLAAAPNISAQALITRGARARGAFVKGVLPAEERKVGAWSAFDNADSAAAEHPAAVMEKLTPGGYGVVLGATLAERLKVGVGDIVVLISPEGRASAIGVLPRLRRFTVAGLFDSGLFEYDANFAYIHFEDARALFAAAGATSIRLRLADLFAAPAVARDVADLRADAALYDWTRSHQGLFRALAVEKRVMFIILSLIVAVAAFNIVSALVTMIRNKRPDIAILRAMGATTGGIVRLFFLQGIVIGGAGAILGVALGVPLAWNAGRIVLFLESNLGLSLFPGDVYQLGALPSRVLPGEAAGAALFAFLTAALAALAPSWRAARYPPAEALRHD